MAEERIITELDGENGEKMVTVEFDGKEYDVVETFSRGSIMYIALMLSDDPSPEPEVELYRFREIEDGIEIIPIETELEFEKALEIFITIQEGAF